MMVLVTGGSASGKSEWAENRLLRFGGSGRIYAATMIPWDEECKRRIKKHRAMRKEKGFETMERSVGLFEAEGLAGKNVLLECLSNLAANEMYRPDGETLSDGPAERILAGLRHLRDEAENLVVVTNEVFSDGGAYESGTMEYRRLLGEINQAAAAMADETVEVVCGLPVFLSGEEERLEKRRSAAKKDRSVHMKLIVGGACQGKRRFAETLLGDTVRGRAAEDGYGLEAAFGRPLVDGLQNYIRSFSSMEDEEAARKAMREWLSELLRRNPDAVVTADEVGCGIVPVERGDRLWRDLCGEACQLLAGEAEEVYRVVCGLPVRLKGGEL